MSPESDNQATATSTTIATKSQLLHAAPTSAASGAQELAAAVDDLLDQLKHKFDNVSMEIFGKLDDMARRLDELEASLIAVDDAASAS